MKTSLKAYGWLVVATLITGGALAAKLSRGLSPRDSFQTPLPQEIQDSHPTETESSFRPTPPVETNQPTRRSPSFSAVNPERTPEPTISQPTESTLRRIEWQEHFDELVSSLGDPAKASNQLQEELQQSYQRALEPLITSLREESSIRKYDGFRELADSIESGTAGLLREIGVEEADIRKTLDKTLEVVHAEEQFAEVPGSTQYRLALFHLEQERLERVTNLYQTLPPDAIGDAESLIQTEIEPWYEQQLSALQESHPDETE